MKKSKKNGFENRVIDVWGFARWMVNMENQPDAYMSTPPDERWGLQWASDESFDLNRNRERIKTIMREQLSLAGSVPVVYMIDHPKPFDTFKTLPDQRQSELTKYFADIADEIGANFILRAYGNEKENLGPKTLEVIKSECKKRKSTYCPS